MMHAGVLKKFGLYFLIQAVVPLLASGAVYWDKTIAVLALVNLIGLGLVTMAQRDFKMMVSYSSVSHMGLCFLGIAAFSVLGAGGVLMLMLGHGMSVAALFICADLLKRRTGTTDMCSLGGLYTKMPVFAGLAGAAIFANIGLPGFANFWGELSIFASLWPVSPSVCILAVTGIIISAVYGLRAFANIFMGETGAACASGPRDITWLERLPLVILLAGLLALGVAPRLVSDGANETLKSIPAYNMSITD